jgi:hypothetical protein
VKAEIRASGFTQALRQDRAHPYLTAPGTVSSWSIGNTKNGPYDLLKPSQIAAIEKEAGVMYGPTRPYTLVVHSQTPLEWPRSPKASFFKRQVVRQDSAKLQEAAVQKHLEKLNVHSRESSATSTGSPTSSPSRQKWRSGPWDFMTKEEIDEIFADADVIGYNPTEDGLDIRRNQRSRPKGGPWDFMSKEAIGDILKDANLVGYNSTKQSNKNARSVSPSGPYRYSKDFQSEVVLDGAVENLIKNSHQNSSKQRKKRNRKRKQPSPQTGPVTEFERLSPFISEFDPQLLNRPAAARNNVNSRTAR